MHSPQLRVLAGVTVSLICLLLACRNVPLDELSEILRRGNYLWLCAALLVQVMGLLGRTRRWQMLLPQASFSELFWAHAIGSLATNIFPLRAGEAARVLVINQRSKVPFVHVAASVGIERVLDVLSVLTILACLLRFVAVPTAVSTVGLVLAAVLGISILSLVTLLCRHGSVAALAGRLLQHRPPHLNDFTQRRLRELVDGLRILRKPSIALAVVGWSIFIWAASIATAWGVIEAVAPGASLVEPAYFIAVVSLGISIPSSPGFVGVFHFIGQQALAQPFPERYSSSSALGVALLAHSIYYVPTSGLGALGLLRLGLSVRQLRGFGMGRTSGSSPGAQE